MPALDTEQVLAAVRSALDPEVASVEWIGSGYWSDCYAFTSYGAELVIRVGRHIEDFRKDQTAHRFASAALPIPHVIVVGEVADGHYAISRRAFGQPLEYGDWDLLLPVIIDLFEALRSVDVQQFLGWGEWKSDMSTSSASWSEYLLQVDQDPPGGRVSGWRKNLEQSTRGHDAFVRGYQRLEQVVTDDVPKSLVHNDLFNRNVNVDRGRITGVFDWGNSILGDHLYDVALGCFWQPWLRQVRDRAALAGLRERWQQSGHEVENFAARFAVCLLHIGLEHIGYNAFLNDMAQAEAVADRMEAVIDMSW